jgi:multicomponent Na+:H+ antiporter subunit A
MLMSAMIVMLVAAVSAPLLARWMGRMAGYPLAAAFLAGAGLLLVDAPQVLAGGVVEQSVPWVPSLGIEFALRLNGLALLFAMLVLGVGALIMSYAPQYLDDDYDHSQLYAVLTLFATGMLGLVLAADLVLLVVFWEVTTLCSFLLVAGRGTLGARPAVQALVVTGFGGLALLGAVVLLVVRTGTSDLDAAFAAAPQDLSSTDLTVVGLLVILAAFTKSAQVPFHFWLPGAMVAITPVSAYLHAATLVKGGIYLLLLFSPLFADAPAWHLTLMSVGLTSALFGAFHALRQNDLKALLAYSTVSQLGLMVALVGVGTSASLAAATVLVAAHALFKATLFMLVGIIDREAGSRDIRRISGLWRVMPVTAGLTALAAMSMAGIPPTVGFVAKEETFYAFLSTSQAAWTADTAVSGTIAALIAVAGAAMTFAYSARIIAGAFAGPLVQTELYEPRAAFLAPAAIPAVLGLVLGLAPWVLNGLVDRAVVDTGFTATGSDLALWHGLSLALGMSATAIGVGTVIHVRRNRPELLAHAEAPPMRGPVLFDRAWYAVLAFGATVGRRARAEWAGAHLAGVLLLLVLLAGAAAATLTGLDPMRSQVAQPADWVVLAILLPAVVALARTGDGMAALVLAGAVGLVLAVWLMVLGAPDVALTLLLVEVLTVVVAAPVLSRIPGRRARSGGRRGAAVAAVLVGGLAGALVLVLTGRRERSEVAGYYLAEAERATGGSNVVNTILVDFRGLDTLGEIVVLAAAALGLLAVTRDRSGGRITAGTLGAGEAAVLRVGAAVVLPLVAGSSAVLFLRGHDEPGGGFIAGLLAGAGVAIARMSGLDVRIPAVAKVVAGGLVLALAAGVIGLVVAGSLLEPVPIPLPVVGYLTTSLVFDLGVLLVVVGLVQAALDHVASRGPVEAGTAMTDRSPREAEVSP